MIAIVDYRAGNLTSVKLAFDAIKAPATITSSPKAILSAERVVFPGVGSIGSAMANLKELDLIDSLRQVVARGTPFMGICLGAQIVLDQSEEDGTVAGLGLVPGSARLFRPRLGRQKVPQIGWNSVLQQYKHPLFDGIEDESEFYFIHSYYPAPLSEECVIGSTEYADVTFASAMARENLVATQFHPERSGRFGLKMLANFVKWKP